MKTQLATIATVLLLSGTLFQLTAQTGTSYTAIDAAKHIGENATITDMVDGIHQSKNGNIFLNMGGKYPNQAFTAFIPAKNAGHFANFRDYDGKTISVSGKITLYNQKPEIVVTSPSQITAGSRRAM